MIEPTNETGPQEPTSATDLGLEDDPNSIDGNGSSVSVAITIEQALAFQAPEAKSKYSSNTSRLTNDYSKWLHRYLKYDHYDSFQMETAKNCGVETGD